MVVGGWWVGRWACVLAEVPVEGVTGVLWVYRSGGRGCDRGSDGREFCVVDHTVYACAFGCCSSLGAAHCEQSGTLAAILSAKNTLQAKTRLEREARLPDRPPPCPGR